MLDDSGSMAYSYLGDEVKDNQYINKIGYRSSLCNKIYYDPQLIYQPPIDASGNLFSASDFNNASYDGFQNNSIKIDLSNKFMAWRSQYSSPATPKNKDDVQYIEDCSDCRNNKNDENELNNIQEAAYYFIYKGDKKTKLGNGSTEDHCQDSKFDISKTGRANWIKVIVGNQSGINNRDERVNFANWYSYYRTRMLMTKSVLGYVFSTLDDNYRVGFSTIGYPGIDANSNMFLNIADFNGEQKKRFFQKLYSARPNGTTPLRAALSKAGQIYAGRLVDSANDPVQFSCQKNYGILFTDGYWNTSGENSGYGPNKIDGITNVGDQDKNLPPPKYEGPEASENSLADVSAYYYETDLRTPALNNCRGDKNVCENNVPLANDGTGKKFQNMITHTVGLGAKGKINYQDNYELALSGDFYNIKKGTKYWTNPFASNDSERIDDLWHAAVNGNGKYFYASNTKNLIQKFNETLTVIQASENTAAAAASSTQEPVLQNNMLFVSSYRSLYWDGDVKAKAINLSGSGVDENIKWSAQFSLDKQTQNLSDNRKIYFYSKKSTQKLKEFKWDFLNEDEKKFFSINCSKKPFILSQCTLLNALDNDIFSGSLLVDYLRGSSQYENKSDKIFRLFRGREHILGAIINAKLLFVGSPAFSYVDKNYTKFRDKQQFNRQGIIYAAANDGMLHAFNALNGIEEWAFIPWAVLPNLVQYADYKFSDNFHYLLDGSPVAGDVCPVAPDAECDQTQWRTILVGGLAGGGRAFYALDITEPTQPQALWTFDTSDDPNLGYSYGNPVITKRTNGQWIVAFTSGYNNINPGDGKGYLYILDAYTGKLLKKISTNSGSETSPSGLAQINSWVDSGLDNTSMRFYGGDLNGKLWRFDIDNIILSQGNEALEFATLTYADIPQPITIKPELSEINQESLKIPVISVATGKYLGLSDLSDTSVQSVYTLKDSLNAVGLGKVSNRSDIVKIQMSNAGNIQAAERKTEEINFDWVLKSGWSLDLIVNNKKNGERVTIDMEQQSDILHLVSNVPSKTPCIFNGESWFYSLNYKTGAFVPASTNHTIGIKLSSDSLVTGLKVIKKNDKIITLLTHDSGKISEFVDPVLNNTSSKAKKISWRELD